MNRPVPCAPLPPVIQGLPATLTSETPAGVVACRRRRASCAVGVGRRPAPSEEEPAGGGRHPAPPEEEPAGGGGRRHPALPAPVAMRCPLPSQRSWRGVVGGWRQGVDEGRHPDLSGATQRTTVQHNLAGGESMEGGVAGSGRRQADGGRRRGVCGGHRTDLRVGEIGDDWDFFLRVCERRRGMRAVGSGGRERRRRDKVGALRAATDGR